jgi:hypothetical protein
MSRKVWLHVLLAIVVLIAVCDICMGEPQITRTGIGSVMMTEYPNANTQTQFSLSGNADEARAMIYMLNAPKNENSFTSEAQRYISSTLGNEFSDIFGREFEGRRVTQVEVIGAYENEILVMSRKIGDKQAAFNKYEPTFGQYDPEKYGVETLPSGIRQHLDYTLPANSEEFIEWEMSTVWEMGTGGDMNSYGSFSNQFTSRYMQPS